MQQLRRLPRAHISPNDAAQLTDLVSFEVYFAFECAARGLAGLFDAVPIHVINPAMIAAANPAGFNPAVIKRSTAVRAIGMDQTHAAKLIAKKQQVFAKPAHEFWRVGIDLT